MTTPRDSRRIGWSTRLALWMEANRLALALRRRPIAALYDELRQYSALDSEPLRDMDIEALADGVRSTVTRWTVPFAGPCLVRSLLLYGVLARRVPGLAVTLGFRSEHGAVPGHAWLSTAGRPLLDADREAPAAYPHHLELS